MDEDGDFRTGFPVESIVSWRHLTDFLALLRRFFVALAHTFAPLLCRVSGAAVELAFKTLACSVSTH